jgi:[acyl-carrier-protein] S-malonyltransferase
VIAFLFPGQGMEEPAHRAPTATEALQPWLVARSLEMVPRLRAAGVCPQVVAGHSIGELAAWSTAGALPAALAVELATLRGALMAREAALHPGSMLALEADAAETEAAVEKARRRGMAALACVNGPRLRVLSGDRIALSSAATRLPARWLPVAGAWHSPAMAGAVDEWRARLHAIGPRPLHTRFVCNRSGEPLETDIAEALVEQMVRPVQWAKTMLTLQRLGVTDCVAVGAGRVLRGLVRLNLGGGMRVHLAEDDDTFERTVRALRS